MRVLVIDNYDSFTYNLVQYLGELGAEVEVVRNDRATVAELLELGADRLVNAVAAYERFGGPCAVADFGTAITFDVVSENGEYLGGVIGPGVEISMAALAERTAKLPPIELGEPLGEPGGVIGKSTHASLRSGIVYGFAGAVDAIARRVQRELGTETRFVATGGLAAAIVPFCEMIEEIDDLLTLTGLRLIWERNR
jgi:type III pantothenate kinase